MFEGAGTQTKHYNEEDKAAAVELTTEFDNTFCYFKPQSKQSEATEIPNFLLDRFSTLT